MLVFPYSLTPLLPYSLTPLLPYSLTPLLPYSLTPLLPYCPTHTVHHAAKPRSCSRPGLPRRRSGQAARRYS
ncbi:hypothetical protein F9K91_06495 [Brucella tritici]|uniref:Uncharacterized protein n=1 Tax=Brucella tritici TaxID=94626 RepID=A0A833FPT5_9HYPH|nr:hypothetical protein F9K91_06495 [Brucella tritici]